MNQAGLPPQPEHRFRQSREIGRGGMLEVDLFPTNFLETDFRKRQATGRTEWLLRSM